MHTATRSLVTFVAPALLARALHLSLSLTTPSSTVRKYNNNKIGRHGQEAFDAE